MSTVDRRNDASMLQWPIVWIVNVVCLKACVPSQVARFFILVIHIPSIYSVFFIRDETNKRKFVIIGEWVIFTYKHAITIQCSFMLYSILLLFHCHHKNHCNHCMKSKVVKVNNWNNKVLLSILFISILYYGGHGFVPCLFQGQLVLDMCPLNILNSV